MKKLIVLALCVVTVFSLAACGQKADTQVEKEITEVETQENTTMAGGWSRAESPVVSDEMKEKLGKALDGMDGASYIPVAYLGSQIVAGTNYALLCRVAPVVPDAVETYAIVYLNETLEGEVSIMEIVESEKTTDISDMPGGWFQSESPVVPDEVRASLEKALDGMVGATYQPIALLSSQVVQGTNYCILCEVTPVVPDAESSYALVYLYVDLDGNAELTETVDFTA